MVENQPPCKVLTVEDLGNAYAAMRDIVQHSQTRAFDRLYAQAYIFGLRMTATAFGLFFDDKVQI